jgi:outer membrane protein OmpA-like peptidoglycan-associated protein
VYGFADNRGDSDYNQELSLKRAFSVSKEIKNVTKVKKMSYEGFGETLPLAENDSSYGRLLNRRTEIVVYFN